jgi:hypothetical protein
VRKDTPAGERPWHAMSVYVRNLTAACLTLPS